MSFALEQIREAIGDAAALKLIEARGGTTVFVPGEPRDGQILTEIVGLDAARELASRWGKEYLMVPLAIEWRIDMLLADGLSAPEVARRLGIHEDRVRRRRRKVGVASSQMDLFQP